MYIFNFILFRIIDIPVSADPVASDFGLHCLPMFQKWNARLIWVNLVGLFFNE